MGRLVIPQSDASGEGFFRELGSYDVQGVAHGFVSYHKANDLSWVSANTREFSMTERNGKSDGDFTQDLDLGSVIFLADSASADRRLLILARYPYWKVLVEVVFVLFLDAPQAYYTPSGKKGNLRSRD